MLLTTSAFAQVCPQWHGTNRDGKVTGFTASETWPKELAKKWAVKVGAGDACPVLVGDKLFLFTRMGNEEVTTKLTVFKPGEKEYSEVAKIKVADTPHPSSPGSGSS